MKQDQNCLVRLERLPTAGESQAERAGLLGASTRIGRAVVPNKVEREAPHQVGGTAGDPAYNRRRSALTIA